MKTWDEMSPRERDALVATEVMGRDMSTHDDHSFEPLIDTGVPAEFSDAAKCCSHCGIVWFPTNPEPERPCEAFWSHYSTDIAAAWEVVEKLREEGWLVRVQEKPDDIGWAEGNAMARAYCSLSWMRRETTEGARKAIHEHPRGMADTAPEAICKAALAARGIEV